MVVSDEPAPFGPTKRRRNESRRQGSGWELQVISWIDGSSTQWGPGGPFADLEVQVGVASARHVAGAAQAGQAGVGGDRLAHPNVDVAQVGVDRLEVLIVLHDHGVAEAPHRTGQQHFARRERLNPTDHRGLDVDAIVASAPRPRGPELAVSFPGLICSVHGEKAR